jgi:hypothetical protein
MTTNEDTSTRTIASVAAILALLALGLGLTESTRSGLIAQFVSAANEVSQNNEVALSAKIDVLNARIEALEARPEPTPDPVATPTDE